MALDLEPTQPEDNRSLLVRLFQEMKATQRSLQLNQQSIAAVDQKLERYIQEQRTRYKENKILRRERCW